MARRQHDPDPRIRIFLAEDEPLVRRGLRDLLSLEPDLLICGEAPGEASALKGILELQPHLALVDLSLAEGDGLSLIKRLHQQCPDLKVLVFSMHAQAATARAAFSAGAHGYVIKEEGADRVVEAIGALMAGRCFLSEQIEPQAAGLVSPKPQLRKRH